jgi:hypothetical protein
MGGAQAAIDEEATELAEMAQSLLRHSGCAVFGSLADDMRRRLNRAAHPRDSEMILERAAWRLRRQWLDIASAATHRDFRTPPADQTPTTATGPTENFGYERELRPSSLERRCFDFFDPPPAGWRADHLLFSSGQAAMAAVLHLLDTLPGLAGKRPLDLAHLGAYFETTDIFRLFPSFLRAHFGADALSCDPQVVVIEPVFLTDGFVETDVAAAVERLSRRGVKPRVFVFDDTLTGLAPDPYQDFAELEKIEPVAIIRLSSGLKLLQGGLELANVGVARLYVREHCAATELSASLSKIRSLLGAGLRFDEVAALEAPWFLDRGYAARYSHAVFENNAAFARTLANQGGARFRVAHPALNCRIGLSPYCVLRLARDDDGYEELSKRIRQARERTGALLEEGGSFGFRGHRCEVVRPDGAPPFLRVALGRRAGWSLEAATAIFVELSK